MLSLQNRIAINSVRGSSFTPASLNPTLWLESGEDYYTQVSSLVSSWNATEGDNATQSNASFRPDTATDSGIEVVDFDTSAKYLDFGSGLESIINTDNNTGGFEIWGTIKLDSGRSGTPVYFGAIDGSDLYFQFFHGGSGRLRWFLGDTVGTAARALTVNSVLPVGQTGWVVFRLRWVEAENQMYIDANGIEMTLDVTQDGDTTGLDFSNYTPTYNVFLNGRNSTGSHTSGTSGMYAGDFLGFDRLLTDSEATNLLNYLI